jgi:hypothetical protein
MNPKFEKCYFCNEDGIYLQPYEFKIIDVCKKHFSMALSS